MSQITPVLKAGKNKNMTSSYRPIAVQDNKMRVFEKLIFIQLNPLLQKMIPSNEYSFKKNSCANHQIIDLIKLVCDALNDLEVICIDFIFLDYSNAYELVEKIKLMVDLNQEGVGEPTISIVDDIHSERRIYVKFNKSQSFITKVSSGLAQGSFLSPVLYNFYYKDLKENIKSHVSEFADDTCLCKIVRKNTDCDDLQEDINSLVEWSESRNLKINSNKTEHLRISLKKNRFNTYQINGCPINTVQEHKHLGLIFDSKLNFNKHCDMIVNKATKKFGFL